MNARRKTAFFALWTFFTLLFGLGGAPLLLSQRASYCITRCWLRLTLWLCQRIMGITVTATGQEHMPPGAAVYASQHQSALDTFALWLLLDNPAFILKRELLLIPVFGWFLWRTGPIAIDRSARRHAIEQISNQAQQQLASGRSVVIFPEGTRRLPDDAPRYKSGGLLALFQLGYPIVPVSLNTGYFWPKAGPKLAGEAQIRLLPPISSDVPPEQLMHYYAAAIAGNRPK